MNDELIAGQFYWAKLLPSSDWRPYLAMDEETLGAFNVRQFFRVDFRPIHNPNVGL